MQNKRYVTRRTMMKMSAGMILPGSVDFSSLADKKLQKDNPIVQENRNEGTTDWQLTYIKSANYRSGAIEGYCSKTSLRPGESVDVFINVAAATDVLVDFYRMGYYGAKGGRFMKRLGPFRVNPQTDPPIAEHRLRACNWERATAFTVPQDWLSGVYLGKLSSEDQRYQSYVILVVRDDRKSDLLFQTSDTTWQAYNKWPGEFSLYDSDSPRQPHSSRTWVSFDRPYGKYPQVVDQPLSQGSGEFLLWEYPLCYWLEQQGYDVTYCSNIDTHSDPKGLERVKCFLSVGHDEYWTIEMYNNVKDAIGQGLNAAFLSGNSVKWVIDLRQAVDMNAVRMDKKSGLGQDGKRVNAQPDTKGNPFRTIRRLGRFGGLTDEEKAKPNYASSFSMQGPNEGLLMGSRNPSVPNGSADWIVARPGHWIFEGTGMKKGDKISGLVGWEHHGDPADIPGLEVIAEGTTINAGGDESKYASTVYPGTKGNWVFNAATIFWSIGLSQPPGFVTPYSHFGRPRGTDERVQRITANFLRKCGIQV